MAEKNKKDTKNKDQKKSSGMNPFGNMKGGVGDGKSKFNFYWIYGILAVVLFGIQFIGLNDTGKQTNWRDLKLMLQNDDVAKIILVNKETAEIFIKPDKLSQAVHKDVEGKTGLNKKSPHYYYTVGSVDKFYEDVETAQINSTDPVYVETEIRHNWGAEVLSWLFPVALLVGVWFFFMRMMSKGGGGAGGQIFNIGKSKAQVYDKNTTVKISFKDVAGLEEAKVEINEIVDFLKKPEKYTKLGAKIPKGVLLVGPPGTGKTLLAKSIAGEADVPFFSISGSDLFKGAKEKSPSIIFIDEIDAIGRARGKNAMTGGNDERENTLNQLLTEMDGFSANSGVIIIAATNRADILDKALMRAGRFDRQIHVELPDLEARKEIFQVHMKPLRLARNVNGNFLAKQTPGFSGADIANVCNESALIAARLSHRSITNQDAR